MATLNTFNGNSNYKVLYNEVKETREEASDLKSNWFSINPLRSKLFEHVDRKSLSTWTTSKIVDSIWRTCVYTAPVALTQIAPLESYLGKEELFLETALINFAADCLKPELKSGTEVFKKGLELPLKEGENQALLCNLYQGTHAFVVHRLDNENCVLYQSYLSFFDPNPYTFDQFLLDDTKHTPWTTKNLVEALSTVVSTEAPLEKRLAQYQKLFFCALTETDIEKKDSYYKFPFVFMNTEPYSFLKQEINNTAL